MLCTILPLTAVHILARHTTACELRLRCSYAIASDISAQECHLGLQGMLHLLLTLYYPEDYCITSGPTPHHSDRLDQLIAGTACCTRQGKASVHKPEPSSSFSARLLKALGAAECRPFLTLSFTPFHQHPLPEVRPSGCQACASHHQREAGTCYTASHRYHRLTLHVSLTLSTAAS